MTPTAKPTVILMAEDDEDDILLVRNAFKRSKLLNDLRVVRDGVELMEYLNRQGEFSDPADAPRPDIILLDLNMPRKDGREALLEIKNNPALAGIPVIVLTTSKSDADVCRSYLDGANSFITKPVTFDSMCEIIQRMGEYWFQIVRLPSAS